MATAHRTCRIQFPEMNVINEGNVIFGMPVATVAHQVKLAILQNLIDGFDHLQNWRSCESLSFFFKYFYKLWR